MASDSKEFLSSIAITAIGASLAATRSKEDALKYIACSAASILIKTVPASDRTVLQTLREQAMYVGAVAYVSPAIIGFLKERSPLSLAMCTVAGCALAHTLFGRLYNELLRGTETDPVNFKKLPKVTTFAFFGQLSKFALNDGTAKGLFEAGSTKHVIGSVNDAGESLFLDNRSLLMPSFCKSGLQFMLYGVPTLLSSYSPQFATAYAYTGTIGKICSATLIECSQTSNFISSIVTKCFNGAQVLSQGRSPF